MRVVVAPDKFAGTLSAAEAAAAMADGWQEVRPYDDVVTVPIADGGEGTLEVIAAAVDAERINVDVGDPLGRTVNATWLLLPDGTALVEAAQACGLFRLAPSERDPWTTSSFGVGQLLLHAAESAHRIVVTLGGSGTVDGGAGMAAALGWDLLDASGRPIAAGARGLDDLVACHPPTQQSDMPISVAVDVTNPLLGSLGAAAVFGPQKGARSADLPRLDAALAHLAEVTERDLAGGPWRDESGAGAAGGLGFALAAFAGGELTGGAAIVAALIRLDEAIEGADVVITGEGKLDSQTGEGKGPSYVAERGHASGALTYAIAGQITDGAEAGFDAALALGPEGLERAAELVRQRAGELATLSMHQRSRPE